MLPVRSSDPSTSYAAALKAVTGRSKIRPVVLAIVRGHGPMTHDQLITEYDNLVRLDPDTPHASHSGLRTRLKELQQAGLVKLAPGHGKSTFGNAAKLWEAVDPQVFVAPGTYDPDATPSPKFDDDDQMVIQQALQETIPGFDELLNGTAEAAAADQP